MADLTSAAFLSRFPEFGEQPAPVVESALAEASRRTPEAVWGHVQLDGVGYLAAHILAVRIMQVGYQVAQLSGNALGDQLKATLYGQEYVRLLDSLPISGFVV